MSSEPLWYEPQPNGQLRLSPAQQASVPKRAAIAGGLLLLGLVLGSHGIVLDVIALILGAVWFLPLLTAKNAQTQAERQHAMRRDAEFQRYRADWDAWHAQVRSWDAGEQARVESADLFFPVAPPPGTRRLDVFGGTPDGWAALLTTGGAALLAQGHRLLVVDLTERDISAELAVVAGFHGHAVQTLTLPAQLDAADLLQALSAEEIGELLAEAIHSARDNGVDTRGLDADLLRTVAQGLEAPRTFAKFAAGLRVLRRTYDDLDGGVLAAAELARLNQHVDAMGAGEQLQAELLALSSHIDLLASTGAAAEAAPAVLRGSIGALWRTPLTVVRTNDHNPRRKDVVDRVFVQSVVHWLRTAPSASRDDVLVLAGADHLGLRVLEEVARQASRAGLRLVVLVEHLRGDLQQLLGGADSASLIMRLGNASEAKAAAEYIGQGHRFVLSQLTRQVSEGTSEGETKSWGATTSVSDSESTSGGTGHWSRTSGFSRADTWSRAVTWGTNQSRSEGTTVGREYAFTVEPTVVQGLPSTALFLVQAGEPRVVMADCNPAISLLPKVAGLPAPGTGSPAWPGLEELSR